MIGFAGFLYAISWLSGCSAAPPANPAQAKKLTSAHQPNRYAGEEKNLKPISGRELTIQKMSQRAIASQQFSDEEYGVALDAPKGFLLKEGELNGMDRGLGYLGPIPMHFAEPGGIRLATVEPPPGAHYGTNFVNEFLTLSVNYAATESGCNDFNISTDSRGPSITRNVDGIEFHGYSEHLAASMHDYNGVYLHAYANGTCYEIGYGIATLGSSATNSDAVTFGGPKPPPSHLTEIPGINYTSPVTVQLTDGQEPDSSASIASVSASTPKLRAINPENELHKLERILQNLRINPPAFERDAE
jgi:hypothetical protein